MVVNLEAADTSSDDEKGVIKSFYSNTPGPTPSNLSLTKQLGIVFFGFCSLASN
jgi:hypothetical protein